MIIQNEPKKIAVTEAQMSALRNAYKPNNKMANNIKFALNNTKKLLLTATPLQNSLLELA